MKLRILYCLLILVIAFGVEAKSLKHKKYIKKAPRAVKAKIKQNDIKKKSCSPISLIKTNTLEQALKCAIARKNKHSIKAIKWLYYSKQSNKASFSDIIRFVANNPKLPRQKYIIANCRKKDK